jgi:hypothetical protein
MTTVIVCIHLKPQTWRLSCYLKSDSQIHSHVAMSQCRFRRRCMLMDDATILYKLSTQLSAPFLSYRSAQQLPLQPLQRRSKFHSEHICSTIEVCMAYFVRQYVVCSLYNFYNLLPCNVKRKFPSTQSACLSQDDIAI